MTVRDSGKGRVEDVIARLSAIPCRITVGVHSPEAGRAHAGGRTVGEIAEDNEFGTSRIPQRSFIRAWFDETQARNNALISNVEQSVAAGRTKPEQAKHKIGSALKASCQGRIVAGLSPPLADSTIRRRKPRSSKPLIDTGLSPPLADSTIRRRKPRSSKPLIDTGQLLGSITYYIDGKKG